MAGGLGGLILRDRFPDLFFSRLPIINEVLFERFGAPALTYQMAFNERDSVKPFEEMTSVTGFGEFVQITEGQAVDYDTLYQGFDKRLTHIKFAKGYAISEEAMDDDMDGAISNATPALARSGRNSLEKYIWNVYNNAFAGDAVPELTADGVALCATNHPLAGPEGGTFDNTVVGDLAVATLEAGMNKFNDMVDDRGLLIEVNPARLVYPHELQWTVHELLASELRPDTSDNASNPVGQNRLGLMTVQTRYITDDDRWFVIANPEDLRVMVFWRKRPQSSFGLDFDTDNAKVKMKYRLSRGAVDWRGVVGSTGV